VGSALGADIDVLNKINNGLENFMKEFGYSSVEKMVGAAHE